MVMISCFPSIVFLLPAFPVIVSFAVCGLQKLIRDIFEVLEQGRDQALHVRGQGHGLAIHVQFGISVRIGNHFEFLLSILDIVIPGVSVQQRFDEFLQSGLKLLLFHLNPLLDGKLGRIGIDAFLRKPVKLHEFSATIRALLDA